MSSVRPTVSDTPPALCSMTEDLLPRDTWRILIVDDDEDDAMLVEDALRASTLTDVQIEWRTSVDAGIEALCRHPYTACIVDFRLGADSGLTFINAAQKTAPHVPVLLLTGELSRDIDLAAMNAGVADSLSKTHLEPEALERSVRYAVENARRRVRLERMARRDPLTGLHNRTSIEERIHNAAERAHRTGRLMALMLLDLDGFKAVNDTLGHAAGDQLLVIVADRLRQTVRGYDMVGRLGGDEFVAIVEDLGGTDEAQYVAERLVAAIRPPFAVRHELPVPEVTVSVGYACFPSPVVAARDLLEAADRAMYAAKRAGKGRAHRFAPPEGVESLTPCSTVVRRAVLRGELRLNLHPVVDLHTQQIVALEGAGQWTPRARAARPTSTAIDLWVFERIVSLCSESRPLSGIVRLTPSALENKAFLARLEPLVDGHVEVEVLLTEGALNRNRSGLRAGLHALKRMGVRLAIDEFGMGYGSLNTLQDLPVDTLRIAPSFVQHVLDRPQNAAIIESMVILADRLDGRVVATGVETPEQARRLVELGIRYGQGQGLAPAIDEARWTETLGSLEESQRIGA